VVFAGAGSIGEYVGVAGSIAPSSLSLSTITGIWWMCEAVLVGGTLLAVALDLRWPRASFVVTVVAMTLGAPSLYASSLAPLLGVLVPFADAPVPVLARSSYARVDRRT
jgi:hypothetical protein